MTTGPFTEAARAEAERRWPRLPHDPSGHYLNMGKRVGFDLGAQWAAAQEPTDAEVEAAAMALAVQCEDIEEWDSLSSYAQAEYVADALAALSAARAGRVALAEGGEVR